MNRGTALGIFIGGTIFGETLALAVVASYIEGGLSYQFTHAIAVLLGFTTALLLVRVGPGRAKHEDAE